MIWCDGCGARAFIDVELKMLYDPDDLYWNGKEILNNFPHITEKYIGESLRFYTSCVLRIIQC
jgi:hypothetical protein